MCLIDSLFISKDRFHGDTRTGTGDLYAEYQALTDRHLLSQVIQHTGGNLSQAARLLGIDRATLRTKLESLGIHLPGETTGPGTAAELTSRGHE